MSYFKEASIICCLVLLLFVGMGGSPAEAGKKHIIKFATLAPEGSSWMKSMRGLAEKIKKATEQKHFRWQSVCGMQNYGVIQGD